MLLVLSTASVQAAYKDDIDFTALESELGASIPDGTAVFVSQVEASVTVDGNQAWMPDTDPTNPEFSSKNVTNNSSAPTGLYSGHATIVGRLFFGNVTSTSPGITDIAAYLADHWIFSGYLRTSAGSAPQPLSSASRVVNHSWIGNAGTYNTDALARLDWAIETDEMLQAVGFTGSSSSALLSSAYNVISVNKTSSPTNGGSADGGGIYTSGRTKPEIVAPANSTSGATPRVASLAAILIAAANANPGWSTDPAGTATSNRNSDTIYNAERVEVIKAALMAGANRETNNSTGGGDIIDYRINIVDQTANGLDRRFGAGQINAYNSYHIIAAGEQNSIEDQAGSAGLIGTAGFDYDPAFGGSNGSNTTATYYLATTSGPTRLTATLAWNLAIAGGSKNNFNGAATLYDLGLQLFDVTDPDNWILIDSSQSANENTENLWRLLGAGKNYALQVVRGATQASFNWDYALAWQVIDTAALAVDSIVLPMATQNQAYPQQTLTASNGQLPYTWSIVGGTLPIGLTLSSGGVVSGTATTAGLTSFTVQVTDANFSTATLGLQLNVTRDGALFPDYNGPCGTCHTASSLPDPR